jgi:hypothetical protein
MLSPGFDHHARRAPHHLAIAAPDGRHWSRGELWAECERLTSGKSRAVVAGRHLVNGSPPDATSLILSALAHEASSPGTRPEPSEIVQAYQARIASLEMQTQGNNVHFCVAPEENSDNLAWAVASLHLGHALVLAAEWHPARMLRAVQHYRVGTLFLDSRQARDLLSVSEGVRDAYDITSVRHLILDLQGAPAGIYAELQDWFGLPRQG